MLIGLARCSTADQNPQLQLDALAAAGCEKVFVETISGAAKDRPVFKEALSHLREGDTLVVWKLDRLSRSLTQLLSTAEELDRRGIELRSLTEAWMDTTTHAGKMILAVMGALAAYERALTLERTRAGIAAARAKGVLGGRPRKFTDAKLKTAMALLKDGALSVREVAKQVGVSTASVYAYLPKPKGDAGNWGTPVRGRIPPVLAR